MLADGTVVRTGSGAVVDSWFGRAPLPDLTGLFVSTQGTTGIVTRIALQLQPKPPHRRAVVRVRLRPRRRRTAPCGPWPAPASFDDVGLMTWPAAKMLFGATRGLARADDEPLAFLFIDITGASAGRARRPASSSARRMLDRRRHREHLRGRRSGALVPAVRPSWPSCPPRSTSCSTSPAAA